MEQLSAQSRHVGIAVFHDLIMSVDFSARPFRCIGDSGDVWLADTVVIATGAQARWLGLPSEQHYQGAGVSACATCDGFFYRGKRVAVVGGGNTAVEEALFLTNFAEQVTLVHRRAVLRADKTNQMRLAANPKIQIRYDTAVDDILGTDNPRGVRAVRLHNLEDGTKDTLDIDG